MATSETSHLGGHLNKTHIDKGALQYLIENFKIKSMVDIGCGPGDQVKLAKKLGIKAIGIDGDSTVNPDICWDYSKAPLIIDKFDLAWSIEFVEHVEEKYIPNYMSTFFTAKYAVITYAPPGWPGHHHVNCQPEKYWIDIFTENNFIYDSKITKELRKHSTMKKPFMKTRGLFFK